MILVALIFIMIPTFSLAAQVTLSWDPNFPSPDGYMVYHRIEGGQYNYNAPAWPADGNDHAETTCTIENLTEGTTYYFVVRAYVDGASSGDSNEVMLQIPSTKSIYHTITVSSSGNGRVRPEESSIRIDHGGSQRIDFFADNGYEISDVRVDGQSVGSPTSYTFNDVVQDHSIAVSFSKIPSVYHTITVSSSGNGQIRPEESSIAVNDGGSQNIDFIPDTGHEISDVRVDGQSVGSPSSYTFNDVVRDHSISVSFTKIPDKVQSPVDEQKVWMEAEDGDIDWPMIIADDPSASESGYVHAPVGSVAFVNSPTDSTGSCLHTFEIASDGEYAVWGRVIANNTQSDSFHVAMDDSNFIAWHVVQTPKDVWKWDIIGNYQLFAGLHTLTIATREAGTRIDRILVTNALDYSPPDMVIQSPTVAPIPKDDWQLVSVDSEELVGEDGAAVNAFDDDPETIWHTEWKYADPAHPHEIVIDLGRSYQLDSFTLLPRRDGINGRIIKYAFYVSNRSDQWNGPVAEGQLANRSDEQLVTFASTVGRYIKLVALSSAYGSPWTSLAEIGLMGVIQADASPLPSEPSNPSEPPVGSQAKNGSILPKTHWQLVSVDSEELVGEDGAATNAFDDNPNTIWHTEWEYANPRHPHEIVIDLGQTYQLDGFTLLPRLDGSINGRIIDYAFYVSNQPGQWNGPVAEGRLANRPDEQLVTFTATAGRYIKLVALSSAYGTPWTSLAEIGVMGF
jgi:hypothetical protein